MANVRLTVTDFTFPADLKDKFAAFRLSIYLRYLDPDDNLVDVMEVLPGGGDKDYWECEKGNKDDANYVRHPTLPKLDTKVVDKAAREVIFKGLKIKSLDQVRVKIYDIEKDGKWDDVFRKGLKVAFDVGLNLISAGTAITVGNALTALKKSKEADRSEVEKEFNKLIDESAKKGRSRVLWDHSVDLEGKAVGTPFTITGDSKVGTFTVDFTSKQ